MLYSTFITMLLVGHALLLAMLVSDRSAIADELTPAIGLLGTTVLGIVALSSASVERVADNGTVVTQSEPAIGIYAFALAVIAFILTLYWLLLWLPADKITQGDTSGF